MVMNEVLRQFEIFQDLTDTELQNIAEVAKKVDFEAEKRIFEEKSIASDLYLVLKGKVIIRKKSDVGPGQITIDTVGPGEMFGWSSITEPHNFTAAAHTAEDSELLTIKSDVLRDLFKKNNHIGYRVMTEIASVISSRFRSLSQEYANLAK
jgi:CRP-like cAMP-binding protein